ncbi:hypothetical protein HYDPIDRAFT_113199 [Hydnomerulius pinastri MD-312]|uniref:Uncharacterized protein n=1 Tax=Hydnomerulius pinastri MD-312 TaxID=994086 RepID=A0A0C9VDX8_9AGAM|nr:hypothetical protein HYDPIDRAFT_113199 [Hydnomerulius pinastri MD-312]
MTRMNVHAGSKFGQKIRAYHVTVYAYILPSWFRRWKHYQTSLTLVPQTSLFSLPASLVETLSHCTCVLEGMGADTTQCYLSQPMYAGSDRTAGRRAIRLSRTARTSSSRHRAKKSIWINHDDFPSFAQRTVGSSTSPALRTCFRWLRGSFFLRLTPTTLS